MRASTRTPPFCASLDGPGLEGAKTGPYEIACGSVAQVAFEDAAEFRGNDEAVHHLARLREVRAAQRGAVGEPDREPIARLTERVRAWGAHPPAEHHVDERLRILRGDPRRRAGRRERGLAALHVDGAH